MSRSSSEARPSKWAKNAEQLVIKGAGLAQRAGLIDRVGHLNPRPRPSTVVRLRIPQRFYDKKLMKLTAMLDRLTARAGNTGALSERWLSER